MNLLDRFAAAFAETDPATLGCLREYCQWMADQREEEFAPRGDDDVHLRD